MKLRVAVIYGGRTGEHEVSVRSARAVMDGTALVGKASQIFKATLHFLADAD